MAKSGKVLANSTARSGIARLRSAWRQIVSYRPVLVVLSRCETLGLDKIRPVSDFSLQPGSGNSLFQAEHRLPAGQWELQADRLVRNR